MFSTVFISVMLLFRLAAWVALIATIVLASREAVRLRKNALLYGMVAAAAFLVPLMLVKGSTEFWIDFVPTSATRMYATAFVYNVVSLMAGLGGVFWLKRYHDSQLVEES